jgi:16S rRNA U1498 N3-methylase RsmE
MDLPTGALGLPSRMATSADAVDVAIGMFALRRDNRRYARHCTVRGPEGGLIRKERRHFQSKEPRAAQRLLVVGARGMRS